MDKFQAKRKYNEIKDFLLNRSSKEFLIFLFFLAMSAAFWFLSVLNDTYEEEYSVELRIVDVPQDVVITQSLPDTVKVRLRDKGFNLLKYYFSADMRPISLHFPLYANSKGRGYVSATDLQKILLMRLASTTSIVSVKADRWEFYYNHGARKRIAVRLDGDLRPAENYFITQTQVYPDSVTVYAEEAAFDTIAVVFTETQTMRNLKESQEHQVPLQSITGAKIEPKVVKMKINVEQLTEVTLNVPVQPINMPEGMLLKTFPARVDVVVAVGIERSKKLKAEQFAVVADYNDLPEDPSQKLKVKVYMQPGGVVKATIKDNLVDYVIEK